MLVVKAGIADTVTTVGGVEVLVESLGVAIKVAVMLSLPTGNAVVVSVATPLLFKGAAPMEFEPFEKVTVPLVTGEPLAVTVAVSVSLWPYVMEGADAVSVVVVGSGDTAFTVTLTGAEVLAASSTFATKLAVIWSFPTGRFVVVSVAMPLPFSVAAPSEPPEPLVN